MNSGSEDQPYAATTQTLSKSTSEATPKRLLLQKINFLGLKVKRRAVIEGHDLAIYKSSKATQSSKKIGLKEARVSFPAEQQQQPNKAFNPSKYAIRLVQNKKFTYWLYPNSYEDYLLLKTQIELVRSGSNIQTISKKVPEEEVLEFNNQPLANSKWNSPNESASREGVAQDDWDDSFHEEDLIEGSDLESTVSYNMTFYSSSLVKQKRNLESKYMYQSFQARKTKFGFLPLKTQHFDELYEGSRDSLVPQSNFNVSELKTKRASVDHSPFMDMNRSERRPGPGSKREKFIRSATTFAGGIPRTTGGRDTEMVDSPLIKATKNNEFFPSLVYPPDDSFISRPVDIYDSFGPHLMGRGSPFNPLEEILNDDEDNLIVRTLSHAREMLEIEEDQKVIERMQSKKEHGSLKYGLSREIRSYYVEGNCEENLFTRLESKKSRMLSYQPANSLEDAFELLHNFELAEAKELFSTLAKDNPRIKLFVIECDLIILSLNGKKELVESCLQELSQLTTQLLQMSPTLKSNPNAHYENEITKAECIVLKGILNVVLNHKWQAFLCISESWRIIKKLEAQLQNPKIQAELSLEVSNRILFAVGAFNLAFSLVPPTLRKILKIVGITPNKQLGLQLLQKCWETKFSRSMYAALLISCYHLEFESDSQKACEVIEKAMIQFCRFPLFSWVGALLSWRFFQLQDVEVLVKNGLEKCNSFVQNPIFLTYELGWYYFITGKWEPALDIFLKVAAGILKPQFFKNFPQDVLQVSKSLRHKGITISTDFGPFLLEDAPHALFPNLTNILLNISACYFELKNHNESDRWLVAALIANKKYLNYHNKTESDFGHLAEKFLKRKSRNMLVFELLYFLKQLVKLPDENLKQITQMVDGYLKTLQLSTEKNQIPFNSQALVEYLSGVLINTVSNCMMGETSSVLSTSASVINFIENMPSEFNYISQHILYWFGRAAISEENFKLAASMLKKAAKIKTNEFSYSEKCRKLIQQHNL